MQPEQSKRFKGLAQDWEAVERKMAELQRQDLANLDLAWAIRALDDAYEAARRSTPPRLTSGLVEMQALFMKGRR